MKPGLGCRVDPGLAFKTEGAGEERLRNFRNFFEGKQKKGYGALRNWKFASVGLRKKGKGYGKKFATDYGLASECFYGYGGAREGVAFPAPVSDSNYIYWGGLWGSRVCLDLQGKVKWLIWQRHPAKSGASGYSHYDAICRSPILWQEN